MIDLLDSLDDLEDRIFEALLFFEERKPRGRRAGKKFPELVKHMARAVGKKVSGNAGQRMNKAMAITFSNLQKWGYMRKGTNVLTAKGLEATRRHSNEPDKNTKDRELARSMNRGKKKVGDYLHNKKFNKMVKQKQRDKISRY